MQQTTVYHINLPQFLNNFKQQAFNLIVPHLLELKAFINSQQHLGTVNPLILVLSIMTILYILKSIWSGLFGKREQTQPATKNFSELNTEVNQLKKQLKSLKSSFVQLIKEIPQHNVPIHAQKLNLNPTSPSLSNENNQIWTQILPLYTLSLENNKKLVSYVLESQFQMLKELKRFKKAQRASLSSGRPSTSTIRSKTSEKKIENSISKSPLKTPINTESSIKKPQIKNSQRSISSQIYEKIEKKTEDLSFLIKEQSPKNDLKIRVINEEKEKNQERNGFQKVETELREKTILQIDQKSSMQTSLNVQNAKNSECNKPQVSHKVQTNQDSSFTKQESFNQLKIEEQVSLSLNNGQNMDQTINQNIGVSSEFVQGSESDQPQLQEPQVFVPMKIPAIKKLNPPKQGAKRPPPPPPKK